MNSDGNRKIFFIGFNKTGTKSLAAFCGEQLGLRVMHGHKWTYWSHSGDRKKLEEFDAFADGECANVEALDRFFPGSLFVWNTRPLESWLRSRHESTERSRFVVSWFIRKYFPVPLLKRIINGRILDNGPRALERWVRIRNSYGKHVFDYFRDRPEDLLVVDLETDASDSFRSIARALGSEVEPEEIHSNRSGTDTRAGRIYQAILPEGNGTDSRSRVAEFLESRGLADERGSTGVIDGDDWFLGPNMIDRLLDVLPFLERLHRRLLACACRVRQIKRSIPGKFLADRLILLVRCRAKVSRFVPVNRNGAGSK